MFGAILYGVIEYGSELIGVVTPATTDVFPIYSNKKDYYVRNNQNKTEPQDTFIKKRY